MAFKTKITPYSPEVITAIEKVLTNNSKPRKEDAK